MAVLLFCCFIKLKFIIQLICMKTFDSLWQSNSDKMKQREPILYRQYNLRVRDVKIQQLTCILLYCNILWNKVEAKMLLLIMWIELKLKKCGKEKLKSVLFWLVNCFAYRGRFLQGYIVLLLTCATFIILAFIGLCKSFKSIKITGIIQNMYQYDTRGKTLSIPIITVSIRLMTSLIKCT